jgi:hypothetical protein
MSSTASTFRDFVDRVTKPERLLPLMHTTDAFALREIAAKGQLSARQCPVYNEDLLYFFYGRATYRPGALGATTSISAFNLCGFIVDGEKMPPPKRVLPFDSGAFSSELYKKYLHPGMTLASFEMTAAIESAAKLVSAFFGTNNNYISGTPTVGISAGAFDFEVQSYSDMISSKSTSTEDDRRSTVELQYSNELDFCPDNLLALIVPETLASEPTFVEFADRMGAETLQYESFRSDPSDDALNIRRLAKEYLCSKALI